MNEHLAYLNTLRNTQIFADASEQVLDQVSRNLKEVNLSNGEALFHLGDPGHEMFIIKSGSVKVHDDDHIFAMLKEGDVFGEYALIDTEVRSASVTCNEDCVFLSLSQDVFYRLIRNDQQVLQGVMRLMVNRLRNLDVVQKELADKNIQIEKQKEEIQEQKERAEQSEKYKEQFLANMSHEIRTPMHAILGMTNILKRNEHLKPQEKYLEAIQQSSQNLVVILNDILDLSKIEAGKLNIDSAPMNPITVIENVMDILRFKAQAKGLAFDYQIDNDVPHNVLGDAGRLNQILVNLAGNAIKFTDKGFVKIILSSKEVNGSPNLQFEVKDTGIGVPEEKKDLIFASFEQGDIGKTKKYGGTGLGLHISKQLVELQNGNIWMTSVEGTGSSFYFTLPMIEVAGEEEAKIEISEDEIKTMGKELSGLRVLLAEDNEFNVMVTTDDLSYYIPNLKLVVASNGSVAISKLSKQDFDLILMDIQMPELNGYDATRKIREDEKASTSKIPIIAMTASLLKTEIQECFQAGMDDYIPKPYKIEELIGTIHRAIVS